MALPVLLRSVLPPHLHILADTDWLDSGHVFDIAVTLDPLFRASIRITEARVHDLDPTLWPEEAESGAKHILVLDSSLVQTVAGTVARAVISDSEDGEQYRDLKSMRRAELAENAAEEAAVARALRGSDSTPAVVVWSGDPRTVRLGY